MKFLIALVALLSTQAFAETCSVYAQRRMKEISAEGYKFLKEGQEPTPEGTIVYAIFGNPETEMLLMDVIVGSTALVDAAITDGFRKTGTCTSNGKTLTTLVGKQKVKMAKPEAI